MNKDARSAEEQQTRLSVRVEQAERLTKLGFWEWDVQEDRLAYCSDGYARILGMTAEQCLAATDSSEKGWLIVHPLDRQRYREAKLRAYEDGVGLDIEYRIVTPQGETRLLREISDALRNDKGQVVGAAGAVQDVTERKQAEELLWESERNSHA